MIPHTFVPCRRCGLIAMDPETCWYCYGPLCTGCWDHYGHCGHPQAIMQDARAACRPSTEPLSRIRTIQDEPWFQGTP